MIEVIRVQPTATIDRVYWPVGSIVAWSGNIGYEVRVSKWCYDEITDPGVTAYVELFTRHKMDVKSGKQMLFGFWDADERKMFDALITVKKLGWPTAIKIMNAGWKEVLDIIATDNATALVKIPGVGPKRAVHILANKAIKALL